MEMMDMGHKVAPTENKEPKVHYPSIFLSGDKIPSEIANAKPGTELRCEIVICVANVGIDTYGDRKQRAELEVRKLGVLGKAGKLTKEEYLNKNEDEREEYDKEQVTEEVAKKEEEE